MMARASEQGLPMADFLGDVFEVIFDEHAVRQIQECKAVLREALDASDDSRRAQQRWRRWRPAAMAAVRAEMRAA